MSLGPRHRLAPLAIVAATVVLAACAQTFAPSAELLPGASNEALYDRIVTRVEDPGFALPSPPDNSDVLVPGDVLQIGYFLTPPTDRAVYRVGQGDVLRLDVAEHPDLKAERVLVGPDGQIALPLLGTLLVAGETLGALSKQIGSGYRKENIRTPHATLSLVESNSGSRQFVNQLLNGSRGTSVLTVIIADDMEIHLPLIEPMDANQSLSAVREDIRRAYQARFGNELDVVVNMSQRAPRNIYVLGEVNRAGAVPLQPGMTPLMAVAAAGGLTDGADAGKVILTRLLPNRDYRYWVVNLKEGLTNIRYRGNTIRLAPQDIVLVPQSAIDEINVYIDKFVKADLPTALQRELGLRGGVVGRADRFSTSRRVLRAASPSCTPDLDGRDQILTVAMIRQLRAPVVSANFNSLILNGFSAGKYQTAEELAGQSLALRKERFGEDHLNFAQGLNTLGLIYDAQGRYREAEILFTQALAIQEDVLGRMHPFVATSLDNLATLYLVECRYGDAEPLYQRALAIRQSLLGPGHGDVAKSLENYANLLRRSGRLAEARELEGDVKRIRQ